MVHFVLVHTLPNQITLCDQALKFNYQHNLCPTLHCRHMVTEYIDIYAKVCAQCWLLYLHKV